MVKFNNTFYSRRKTENSEESHFSENILNENAEDIIHSPKSMYIFQKSIF